MVVNAREVALTRGTLITSVAGLAAVAVILLANGSVLLAQLKAPGGIIPTSPRLFELVGSTIVVGVAIAPNKRQRGVRGVLLGIYLVCAAMVAWIWSLHPWRSRLVLLRDQDRLAGHGHGVVVSVHPPDRYGQDRQSG